MSCRTRTQAAFAAILMSVPGISQAESMLYPLSVAAAEDGTLYVADRKLPGVWKVEQGKASVYFRAEKKFRTPLNAVRCVALDHEGRLLAGDSGTREVYRFDTEGKPHPLTNGGIGIPMDIAVSTDGTIYVADLELQKVCKVPAAGGTPESFVDVPAPRGLGLDSEGNLWIVSGGPAPLWKSSNDGQLTKVIEGRKFRFPHDVAVKQNEAFVSDGYGKTIWKVSESGEVTELLKENGLKNPVGITTVGEGLFVADPHAKTVHQINEQGEATSAVESSP